MKFSLMFFFYFLYYSAFSQIQEIRGESDWLSIVKKSSKESKPVFLDFYTDWCTPCKKMDKTVFVDSTVLFKLNNNFISTKINAESEFGKKLNKAFNISAYPTYAFVSDGVVPYYFVVGFRDKVEFHAELDRAISQKNNIKSMEYYSLMYSTRKDDPVFIKSYVDKLSYNGKDSLANNILESYFSKHKNVDFTKNENLELLAIYIKDCENYMFDTLKSYIKAGNENVYIRGKMIQAYEASIKSCLKRAMAKNDNVLFDKIVNFSKSDPTSLNIDYKIMNLKLSFYEKTGQKNEYYLLIKDYANSKLTTTEDTLRKEGLAAYAKIYKNRSDDTVNKDLFVKNWIKGDIGSIAGDLNYFSQIYYNELKNDVAFKSALLWSKRACELMPNADHFNTYAHILYKLDKRGEAITEQKKAVDATTKNTKENLLYETELEYMINNREVSSTL